MRYPLMVTAVLSILAQGHSLVAERCHVTWQGGAEAMVDVQRLPPLSYPGGNAVALKPEDIALVALFPEKEGSTAFVKTSAGYTYLAWMPAASHFSWSEVQREAPAMVQPHSTPIGQAVCLRFCGAGGGAARFVPTHVVEYSNGSQQPVVIKRYSLMTGAEEFIGANGIEDVARHQNKVWGIIADERTGCRMFSGDSGALQPLQVIQDGDVAEKTIAWSLVDRVRKLPTPPSVSNGVVTLDNCVGEECLLLQPARNSSAGVKSYRLVGKVPRQRLCAAGAAVTASASDQALVGEEFALQPLQRHQVDDEGAAAVEFQLD